VNSLYYGSGYSNEVGIHVTGIDVSPDLVVPQEHVLFQNYPNPFNPATEIKYQIAEGRSPIHVALTIFNILGQEVRTLFDEDKQAGSYSAQWDGRDRRGRAVAGGLYVYRLQAGDHLITKKMILLR
jgi:flagellar hook assembly protein FlgD